MISTITYNGKEYYTREITVSYEHTTPFVALISTESLLNAFEEHHEEVGTDENIIDDSIWYYCDDDMIDAPIKELAEHIDIDCEITE